MREGEEGDFNVIIYEIVLAPSFTTTPTDKRHYKHLQGDKNSSSSINVDLSNISFHSLLCREAFVYSV